jgi:hypothetical protein
VQAGGPVAEVAPLDCAAACRAEPSIVHPKFPTAGVEWSSLACTGVGRGSDFHVIQNLILSDSNSITNEHCTISDPDHITAFYVAYLSRATHKILVNLLYSLFLSRRATHSSCFTYHSAHVTIRRRIEARALPQTRQSPFSCLQCDLGLFAGEVFSSCGAHSARPHFFFQHFTFVASPSPYHDLSAMRVVPFLYSDPSTFEVSIPYLRLFRHHKPSFRRGCLARLTRL